MSGIVDTVWFPYVHNVNPAYAGSLARRLEVGLSVVYAPPESVSLEGARSRETEASIQNAVIMQASEVDLARLKVQVQRSGPLKWPDPGALVVSNNISFHPTLPVLHYAFETGVRNPSGPIVIGFSNKPELEWGYRYGILLAKQLGVRANLWHTTWTSEGVSSEDPWDHMHEGARAIADDARSFAKEHNVSCEIEVVRAPKVVGSLHEFALESRAQCIVVQRVSTVDAGGYETQLCQRSLVPALVLPERSCMSGDVS